jgi:D-methionine transport system ATP-binding protein
LGNLKAVLKLKDVSLQATVGRGTILHSLTFAIMPGELVGVIGPSGAGKSSLLKLLNRLRSPSTGSIEYQEHDLVAIAPPLLRQQVVLVGQDVRLLGMTVEQALHYPLVLQKCSEPERNQRVAEGLRLLHLPTEWLDKTELELSGGQQQQVSISRALIMRPTVLLLDEPTAALDLGTATHVLSVLQAQVRETGMTVVMCNHQLELMEKFCDRILYLESGRLLWDRSAVSIDWTEVRESLLAAKADDLETWEDPSPP